jgi:hypothetical protein
VVNLLVYLWASQLILVKNPAEFILCKRTLTVARKNWDSNPVRKDFHTSTGGSRLISGSSAAGLFSPLLGASLMTWTLHGAILSAFCVDMKTWWKGNRLNYTQLSRTVANQEQINVSLLQKIEMLEQEKVQERQHYRDLEQTMMILSQRVDALEQGNHQFRGPILPPQSNSGSINQLNLEIQAANPEEIQGNQELVPMEIEDDEPNHEENLETPDNESTV